MQILDETLVQTVKAKSAILTAHTKNPPKVRNLWEGYCDRENESPTEFLHRVKQPELDLILFDKTEEWEEAGRSLHWKMSSEK